MRPLTLAALLLAGCAAQDVRCHHTYQVPAYTPEWAQQGEDEGQEAKP